MSLINQAVLSPLRAGAGFKNDAGAMSIAAVDTISDTLQAGGWSLLGGTFATATLTAPFGFGYAGFQGNVCSMLGNAYVFWDPSWQTMPFGKIGPNTIVPVLSTGNAQANLCAAMSGFFICTIQSSTVILLTAVAPGPMGDGGVIEGQPSGSTSFGSVSVGVGLILQSQQQATPLNTAQITLKVIAGNVGAQASSLIFTFTVHGYNLDWVPAMTTAAPQAFWFLTASSYGVLFYTLYPDPLKLYSDQTFAWAAAPVIDPSQIAVLSFAAFVALMNAGEMASTLGAPPFFGGTGLTVGTWSGKLVIHQDGGVGQRGWAVFMDHSQGQPIVDPVSGAIFSQALVAMPEPISGESRLVGYLPDCFASTVADTFGRPIVQAGYKWRAIATQSEPPGTLWMATGE